MSQVRSRQAGENTRPKRRRGGAVYVSWLCPHCGMRFDDQQDREDHVNWLHGDPIIGGDPASRIFLGVDEPPADHPDWDLDVADHLEQAS